MRQGAGSLRHRVDLQAPTQTVGDYGGVTKTWNTVDTDVAANVRDNVGTNYYLAQQEQNKVSVEVRMRWRWDVKATWRVIFGLRTLEIISAQDPDGRQRELVLYCKEIT